jgi:SAM-dependent methyltransferase
MIKEKKELNHEEGNENAIKRWGENPIGSEECNNPIGTAGYFQELRDKRYKEDTCFIADFLTKDVNQKQVLEIGVGNGTDACELIKNGAIYTGLDICSKHLDLTKMNLDQNNLSYQALIQSDLLEYQFDKKFDVVYSFGVLHHIKREQDYVLKINKILNKNGELRVGLYSKYSFNNMRIVCEWLILNTCKMDFNIYQGTRTDNSDPDNPLVVKIRSKREIVKLYKSAGFELSQSFKRRGAIPRLKKWFKPDGFILDIFGRLFGWYHVLYFKKSNQP